MNRKDLTVVPHGTIAERATGVNETGEMGQVANIVHVFPTPMGEQERGAAEDGSLR